MKASRYAALALVPMALATMAYAGSSRRAPPPDAAPMATPVGPSVSCIPLNQIRETRIRDDYTIDFISSGKRAWRNRLTSRCPGLKVNDGITYRTSLSELCSTEIIYVLETAGGLHRGPACGLGQFVPVELER